MELQYEPCGCDPQYLRRRHRSWWMRLLWNRRLYECKDCRQHLLIPEPQPEDAPLTQAGAA